MNARCPILDVGTDDLNAGRPFLQQIVSKVE